MLARLNGRHRIVLAAVLVLAGLSAATALRATEYFADDFEGYVDDTELVELGGWKIDDVNNPVESSNPDPSLRATWTVMNYGGRINPPTANGTPSSGQFLISDSDHAKCTDATGTHECGNPQGSGMSHDIWTPSFSCAAATTVWLHFDATIQMNNNGLCVFDIDVSTDDGTSWTNVFRRVAPSRTSPPAATTSNADGFMGWLSVDLSAAAAHKPNVKIRFRQFEPEDDWWFAIDDVVVDDQPVKFGAVNLLSEGFPGGIPSTWTVRSNASPPNEGTQTWNSADICKHSVVRFNAGKLPYQDGRGIHRLDAGYALMDSDCQPALTGDDEYLITPVMDCSNATEVFLHYKSEIVVSNAAVQDVLLSLDGGDTFEDPPIFSYNAGAGFVNTEESFYAERIFPIPAAAGQKHVAFAFRYMSPGAVSYWAIDDVKVSANGNGLNVRNCPNREFAVQPFDPTTSSVTMSWKGIPGDDGFRILGNGTQIGADLPSSARSFTDTSPPSGGSVAYGLQTLVGGTVEFECTAPPVSVILCPRDFSCCVNQATKVVTLSWKNGVNLAGTGYRVLRNGIPIKTLPATSTTYTDSAVPGSGSYDYQLVLNGGNPGQCPDLPLKCRANVLGGDLVFYDDFDCYLGDAALTAAGWQIHEVGEPVENAAWTVTDPGGRGNPPQADGTPTTGKSLCSDSDAADGDDHQGTGRSHDVWTPAMNCTGKSTVWLHAACTLVLNNNGEVVFDTDVSSDNGATWNNVFRRVAPARSRAGYVANCLLLPGETDDDCNAKADLTPVPLADIPDGLPGGPQVGNADGFFGSLDVDLSAFAANKPNVRVRFRQFEPSDDWWMVVDNVLIDTKPIPRGSRTVFGPESFDDGLPPDWPVDSDPGTAPWTATDPCLISALNANGGLLPDQHDGQGLHHLDDHFAIAALDETCQIRAGNETLITPTIDCSGTTAVYLHFKSDLLVTDAVAEVLLSLDGGATFDTVNPVFSYFRGASLLRNFDNAEVIYNGHTLPVPQAVDQKKVAFAFHYMNSANRLAFWAIDDVEVTADGGGVVAPKFHRGDADDNGKLELTDAVRILGFLYLGKPAPPCFDAADADDNGKLELTDAVRILGFLYLGKPAPSDPGPPPAACGVDPTPADGGTDLGCASYTNC